MRKPKPDTFLGLIDRLKSLEREARLIRSEIEFLTLKRTKPEKPARVIDPRTDKPYAGTSGKGRG